MMHYTFYIKAHVIKRNVVNNAKAEHSMFQWMDKAETVKFHLTSDIINSADSNFVAVIKNEFRLVKERGVINC